MKSFGPNNRFESARIAPDSCSRLKRNVGHEITMPMIPSPVAALVYAAVKVGGYAAFAYGLNKFSGEAASPIKFASAKTAFGLVGGISYVLGIAPAIGIPEASDSLLFLGVAPLRLLVWGAAIGFFYGFAQSRSS